jgi:hypothetical protein
MRSRHRAALVARPLRPRVELKTLLVHAKSVPRSEILKVFVVQLVRRGDKAL